MLLNLSIENVALIEYADVTFGAGFNVLTGETGAGKSILIHSVNLLLGQRTGHDIIRTGAESAYVEGLFYLSETAKKILDGYGIATDEDGSLIVSRKILKDGKNICKVGGKSISVSILKEIGDVLMNVHGQHDNQALLNASSHISFLDAYAMFENQDVFHEYQALYRDYLDAKKELDLLDVDENEKNRRIDVLTFEIDEITKASLSDGEEAILKEKRNIVQNKAEIQNKCASALDLLYGNHAGNCAYNMIYEAQRNLESIADSSKSMEEISGRLADLYYSLEDIVDVLQRNVLDVEFDDISIDEIEARLDLIYRLKRKYGDSEEEIISYCENAEKELAAIQSSDTRKIEIENKIKQLYTQLTALSVSMHTIRLQAAKEIEEKIHAELAEMNMEGAVFSVAIRETEMCKNGVDEIEFLLSANRGEPAKPLAKIVSGGELSRIMLALKNVLFAGDVTESLIFDEIDTGISGRVATKVGLKLREIAERKQVFCVTHLPQIASLSQHHFKIFKQEDQKKTITKITSLNDKEKINEVAFMIGGDHVSDTTLAQAAEMVQNGLNFSAR